MQKRNVLKDFGIVTIVSIILAVGLNCLLLLINLPQYSERYQEANLLLWAPPLWQQILYNAILIPIFEEAVFRGLLFRVLRKWISFPWATLISAVAFGAYHGNLVQFVYAGICGVLLAYWYEKYQSIIAPIWSHMVMNLTAIVLTQTGALMWLMKP